jgi:hypothetical protein
MREAVHLQEEDLRKIALLVVVAVAGALGIAAVASAVNPQQQVTVTVSPNRAGTSDSPRNVSRLRVALNGIPAPGEAPFVVRRATVHFDRNLVFNTRRFPSCSEAQARVSSARCTAARLGSGRARGGALALNLLQDLSVTAYNGSNNRLYLRLQTLGGAAPAIDQTLVGRLRPGSGSFGRKLVVDIPPELQSIAGAQVTLLSLNTTINPRSRRGETYVRLRGCTDGELNFRADFEYTDGTRNTAQSAAPCRRR